MTIFGSGIGKDAIAPGLARLKAVLDLGWVKRGESRAGAADALHDELADLAAVEAALSARLAAVRREKAEKRRQAVEADTDLRRVTDHALVRYMERHKGIDVNAIRAEMRAIAAEAVAGKDGEHHWHPSGVIFILGEDGQIITTLSPEQSEKWAGRRLANGERIPPTKAP